MRNELVMLIALTLSLTACTSNTMHQQQAMNTTTAVTTGNGLSDTPGVDTNRGVGGNVAQGMDNSDQLKMSRALDKPLGKETTWKNMATGTDYIVVPTEKTEVNGNRLCRRYNTTATRNGTAQQYSGTACITADGNWHPVG